MSWGEKKGEFFFIIPQNFQSLLNLNNFLLFFSLFVTPEKAAKIVQDLRYNQRQMFKILLDGLWLQAS